MRIFIHLSTSCVLTAILFLQAHVSIAQPNISVEQKPYQYRIKHGDTLNLILEKYLTGRDALIEILQANAGINQNELQVGQIILIPRQLIRYIPSRAVVAYSKCGSIIFLVNNSKELKIGSVIEQGDVINVPPQCDISLQFEDRSVVRMPSGGSIKVNILRKSPLEKSPEVELNLLDGRVEVKVPKRQSGDAPFGVNTPNSVAGVRGTEFRVGFDKVSGAGKVEVSSGLVATKGVADAEEAGVSAQKGVVIPKLGLADKVEDLPTPVSFSSVQAQQASNWNLFIFKGSQNSKSYYLHEARYINSVGGPEPLKQSEPVFLSTQSGPNARILTWSAETASGLTGDESSFGICVDSAGLKPSRCNVFFDLTGLNNPLLTLVEINPPNPSIDILRAYKPMKGLKDLMVKGLPAGKYRWEVQHFLPNGESAKQEGRFELIAATRN